jgi:hypothetical protein
MTKRTAAILVCLMAVIGPAVFAQSRDHYWIANRPDKTPAFRVTRIHEDGGGVVDRTYLIADSKGPLLRVDLQRDYSRNTNTATYTLMRESGASVKIGQELPYSTRTRDDVRNEIRIHPELARAAIPVTIVASSGQRVHGQDAEWRNGNATENRGKARAIMDKQLMVALDRVRELAGLPMFADMNASLGYIFDESNLVWKSRKLMVATVKPDCKFDATFEVPCAR